MPKRSYPLAKVYALLEPGPVVLLTTAHRGRMDVMTMSWHVPMEFEPPLVGCVVSDRDFSHGLLKASGECAINIPTKELLNAVVGCGNTSGRDTDKFVRFGLTSLPASMVSAPLIKECFANLECRVVDKRLAKDHCFFVLEVVKAWRDPAVKHPRTLHHEGRGTFMVAGERMKTRSRMK